MHGTHSFKTKLSAKEIDEMSKLLVRFRMPLEIHRVVRGLDCINFWKGTEFRTFLLYVGPVILKDFLNSEVYYHFLQIFCAITICTNKVYNKYIDIADHLLTDYIEGTVFIYGINSISPNVHYLEHLVKDVKHFGPLPTFSAFVFENCLFHIKCLLRTGHRPLAQVAKRLSEYSSLKTEAPTNDNATPSTTYPFTSLPRKKAANKNVSEQTLVFDKLELEKGFSLKTDKNNKWFMVNDNRICAMFNATMSAQNLYIVGAIVKQQNNFFEIPINSSRLNIYTSHVVT